MNNRTGNDGRQQDKGKDDDPALLKVARLIDPPGKETSDDELIDPGKNIKDTPGVATPGDKSPPKPRGTR